MSPRKTAKPLGKIAKPKFNGPELNLHGDIYTRLCALNWYKLHAERIAASRKLLRFRFFRGDCHVHSNYSDGRSSISQIKEAAEAAGLDFVFVTDHGTIDQKYECRKFRRIWWGQEPGDGPHHLGILGTEKTFRPTGDFLKDFRSARTSPGALTFVPHPCGWFPTTRYTAEQINLLKKLAHPFHMEIVNGANQFFDCWDITDAQSVQLWDRLLTKGKIVYALGNSDAHMVHGIGSVWNGVLSERCNKQAILSSIRQGHCFVSDGPLINLTASRAEMGQTIRPRRGSTITFQVAAADSAGIYQVRLIKNGQIVKRVAGRERRLVRIIHRERFVGRQFYLRAEISALDSRRAFSNPIFVANRAAR